MPGIDKLKSAQPQTKSERNPLELPKWVLLPGPCAMDSIALDELSLPDQREFRAFKCISSLF